MPKKQPDRILSNNRRIKSMSGTGGFKTASEVLSEIVWWTRSDETAQALKVDPRYQDEVVYALHELHELMGKSPELVRDIHRLKREFGAALQKALPHPALGSGVNAEPAYTVADARSGPPQGGS